MRLPLGSSRRAFYIARTAPLVRPDRQNHSQTGAQQPLSTAPPWVGVGEFRSELGWPTERGGPGIALEGPLRKQAPSATARRHALRRPWRRLSLICLKTARGSTGSSLCITKL